MKKMVSVITIDFAFLTLTGFQRVEKVTETISGNVIPKEKKELLNKIVGRWITQTNIHARDGKMASKVIGSDGWQW